MKIQDQKLVPVFNIKLCTNLKTYKGQRIKRRLQCNKCKDICNYINAFYCQICKSAYCNLCFKNFQAEQKAQEFQLPCCCGGDRVQFVKKDLEILDDLRLSCIKSCGLSLKYSDFLENNGICRNCNQFNSPSSQIHGSVATKELYCYNQNQTNISDEVVGYKRKRPLSSLLQMELKIANHKTKICVYFFNSGYCKYGQRCNFAHDKTQLQKRKNIDLGLYSNWNDTPGGIHQQFKSQNQDQGDQNSKYQIETTSLDHSKEESKSAQKFTQSPKNTQTKHKFFEKNLIQSASNISKDKSSVYNCDWQQKMSISFDQPYSAKFDKHTPSNFGKQASVNFGRSHEYQSTQSLEEAKIAQQSQKMNFNNIGSIKKIFNGFQT